MFTLASPPVNAAPRRSRRAFLAGLAGSALAAAPASCVPGPAGRAGSARPRTVAIQVWLLDKSAAAQRAFADRIVPDFRARFPWIVPEVTWRRWGRHLEEVESLAALGPDVFQFGYADSPSVALRSLALPLDGLWSAWGAASDFFPACAAAPVWDGVRWGVPTGCAPTTVFWRTDILEEVGFTRLPRTWEDTMEVARKATVIEGGKLMREGMGPATADETMMLFMAIGGRPVVVKGRSALGDTDGRETLRYAVERWRVSRGSRLGLEPPRSEVSYLVRGMLAGRYGNAASTLLHFVTGAPDLLDRVAVGDPPVPGGGDYKPADGSASVPVVQTFTDSLGLSPFGREPDAAWEFVKHVASPDALLLYCESLFLTPPRRSATGRGYALRFQNAKLVALLDRWGVAAPKMPGLAGFRSAIARALPSLFEGRIGIEQGLAAIVAEQNAALEAEGFNGEITGPEGIRAI